MYRSEPLRVGHVGELKFKLHLPGTLSSITSAGYIDISLWTVSTMGVSGGFGGPLSKMVCTILKLSNNERFGCEVTYNDQVANYYVYRLQTFESLASAEYEICLTTQKGDSNEGLVFPTVAGIYKIEIQADYNSGSSQQISQAHYVEVYGPKFNTLNFISTISNPEEYNMILVELIPPATIATNKQIVI